jgi:uncharacterized protein YjiS (DUF1127 family)
MITSSPNKRRGRVVYLAGKVFRALADWSEKRRSRAALRALTDDQLLDIGLTRHEVHREVAKSFFWD